MRPPTDQRIIFTVDEFLNYGPGATPLIPEIAYLGWCRTERADRSHLAPHSHRGVFEITLVLDGELDWIGGGEIYRLRRGDLFVTMPGEVHSSRDHSLQPCSLFWVLLGDPECGYEWPGIESALAVHILTTLRSMRRRGLKARPEVQESFKMLFDAHVADAADAARMELSQMAARAALHGLMVGLVRSIEDDTSGKKQEPAVSQHISRTLDLLRSQLRSQVSIADLLQIRGAALDRLNKDFSAAVGLTMAEFRSRERVRVARDQLVGTDQSVTRIASELGYSSSQHFATAFKQATGFTPKEYRLSHLPLERRNDAHSRM